MPPKTVEVPPSLAISFEARGLLSPGALKRDGKWHPVDAVDDDPGEGSGRYRATADEPFVVLFTNWKDGLPCEHWRGQGNGHARKIPPEELAAMQAASDQERAERQAKAAQAARAIWEQAVPATPEHPYLVAKGIKPDGLRVKSFNPLKGGLCIPLLDPGGELVNLQYIAAEPDADGKFPRRYHPGARRVGTFCAFGPWPPKPEGIVKVEGAATAISVHKSTGGTVVAAMDAGNLLPTAEALRKKYPKVRFTFFADNDRSRVGITKAIKAAAAVDGNVCMSPTEGDDANDLYRREGPGAVKAVLASAKPVGEWQAEQAEGRDPSLASVGTGVDGVRPAHSPATSLFESFEALQEKQPPQTFLVDGLIETPSSVLFFGPSGGGKTFAAVDLTVATTTGGEWFGGRKVASGLVFLIAGEGRRGLLRRLQAGQLARNVQIPPGRLFLSTQRIELDAKGAAAVDAEIERRAVECDAAPALIIVDTVARALPSDADENSAKDMGAFVNVMDGIRDHFQCVVVLVHHSGHPDNKRTSGRARGSSSLRAAMDAELSISRSAGGFKAEWTKLKDLPDDPAPLGFILESVDVGTDEAGKPVTSAAVVWRGTGAVSLTETEALGLQVLLAGVKEHGGAVPVEAVRQAFVKKHPGATSNVRATAWGRAREGLALKGFITLHDGRLSWTGKPPQKGSEVPPPENAPEKGQKKGPHLNERRARRKGAKP